MMYLVTGDEISEVSEDSMPSNVVFVFEKKNAAKAFIDTRFNKKIASLERHIAKVKECKQKLKDK